MGKEFKPGLVSVVIPTYNHEDFITETLESVLSQDYENIEIIVTDDCSQDDSVAIVQEYAEKYPGRVIPVFSDSNTGNSSNINRGLRKARGEYIAWLGGDDVMLPGKLRLQVETLNRHPDAIGVYHDAEVFRSDDGHVYGLFSKVYNNDVVLRSGGVELWFDPNYFMLPSTVMIRRSAAPTHGYDERLKFAGDWLFDVEVFKEGRVIPVSGVYTRYRRHGENLTSSKEFKDRIKEELLVSLGIIEARYPRLAGLVQKKRIALIFSLAIGAFRSDEAERGFLYLIGAMRQGAYFKGGLCYLFFRVFGDKAMMFISAKTLQKSRFWRRLVGNKNFQSAEYSNLNSKER